METSHKKSRVVSALESMKFDLLVDQLTELKENLMRRKVAEEDLRSEGKQVSEMGSGCEQPAERKSDELYTVIECAHSVISGIKAFIERCCKSSWEMEVNTKSHNIDSNQLNYFIQELSETLHKAAQSIESLKKVCSKMNEDCLLAAKQCDVKVQESANKKEASKVISATTGVAAAGGFVVSSVIGLISFGSAAILGLTTSAALGAGSKASAVASNKYKNTETSLFELGKVYESIAEMAFQIQETATDFFLKIHILIDFLEDIIDQNSEEISIDVDTTSIALNQLKTGCDSIHQRVSLCKESLFQMWQESNLPANE